MTKIDYDPVKDRLAKLVRNSRILRRIFYFFLDLLFLRSWHLRRVILMKGIELDASGKWNLLDAGSGFGQYERYLLSRFQNVRIVSIDLKEGYLEDSRRYFRTEAEEGRIEFKMGDLLTFDEVEKFDFIICIDVLEHIEEDQHALQNLSRALKKNGYLLMHSPSHLSKEDGDQDDTFVGEHARSGYSKDDIEKKLMIAGLIPEITHYTYGKWGRRSWVISVKWPMILLNRFGLTGLVPLLIYYPVLMPFILVMNCADLVTKNRTGHGIYSFARKI